MLDAHLSDTSKAWTDEARAAALEARRRTASAAQRDAHEHLTRAGWRFHAQAEGMHVYAHPEYPRQQIGVAPSGAWTHQDWRPTSNKTMGRGGAVRELSRHLNGGRLV